MSKFFISRPIVAIVIAIVTVILGVVSLASLPDFTVSQYRSARNSRHRDLPRS